MLIGQRQDAIQTSPLIRSRLTDLQLSRTARNEGSRSPIREGVPKGRALQRCQSFFGRLVLLCQSGDQKGIR